MTTCTRCDHSGFLNIHQLPDTVDGYHQEAVEAWIEANPQVEHDIVPCDCCDGSGEHGYDERTFDCM